MPTANPWSEGVVIAQARPGAGGLGAAAAQVASAWTARGAEVSFVGSPDTPTAVRRLLGHRPWRGLHPVVRAVDRRAVRRGIPAQWDFAYAMPGLLPDGPHGVKLLHQATHRPDIVRAAIRHARRSAGGGRGIVSLHEQRLLLRELHHADVIRTESAAVATELFEYGLQQDRIVHARPGVDLRRFAPGDKHEVPVVAFVGAFSLWKGAHHVVEVAQALGGRAKVAVVGGPVCRWSRQLAATAPVEWTSDVPAVLSRAHALILPSYSDGFGYVVLEAMASGAIPFVTPAVGAAEVVRELDPQLVLSHSEFVDGVVETMSSASLDRLSQAARQIAEAHDHEARGAIAVQRLEHAANVLAERFRS